MPLGFEMLKKKLAKAYNHLCPLADKPCKVVLQDVPEYKAINKILPDYMGYSLRVHRAENDLTRYHFFLEDDKGARHEFDEISS